MSSPGDTSASGHPTILLVDDNADVTGAYVAVLEMLGYRPLAAGSGEEGIRRWRAERDRVALVIMDQTLPDMRGLDAIRRLRAEGLDIPCIVLTAGPMQSGRIGNRRLSLVSDTFEAVGRFQRGEIGAAELEHLRLAIEAAEMGPLPAELYRQLDALADDNFGM